MPIDSLIVLSRLKNERRLSTVDLMASIQKSEASTRATLEKLSEVGLVEPHGSGRGRTFTLSAKLYRNEGQKAAYIRQAGFDSLQQEQMILSYIDNHKSIKRADVVDLCRLSPSQASRFLKKLANEDKIKSYGEGKGTFYKRCT